MSFIPVRTIHTAALRRVGTVVQTNPQIEQDAKKEVEHPANPSTLLNGTTSGIWHGHQHHRTSWARSDGDQRPGGYGRIGGRSA